jgi:signal peptidase I
MEWLANLSAKWVLVGVGALVLGLTLVRLLMTERDQAAVWLIENIQVVLSVVVVVFLVIRPFLFQAFYIPSGSMEPTLLGPANGTGAGDRLLVNKLVYRVSNPHRGDIVVFHAPPEVTGGSELHGTEDPSEGKEFIKRVMGEPGETISVAPPRVTIDGKQAISLTNTGSFNNGNSIAGISIGDQPPHPSKDGRSLEIPSYGEKATRVVAVADLHIKRTPYRVEANGQVLLESPDGRIQEMEGLANRFGADPTVEGRAFKVEGTDGGSEEPDLVVLKGQSLAYKPGQVMINGKAVEDYTPRTPEYGMAPVKLGPDQYFMMGDNRNNSNDSHAWGPLKRDRVIGRAEIIFWPLNRFKIFNWWLLIALAVLFVGYELVSRLFRSHHEPQRRAEVSPSPSR